MSRTLKPIHDPATDSMKADAGRRGAGPRVRPSHYFRVVSFGRFAATVSRVENAPALTLTDSWGRPGSLRFLLRASASLTDRPTLPVSAFATMSVTLRCHILVANCAPIGLHR